MQDIDNIIRAWKDDGYRLSLSAEEQQALPENPAGPLDLGDPDLDKIADNAHSIKILILCICLFSY